LRAFKFYELLLLFIGELLYIAIKLCIFYYLIAARYEFKSS